MVYDGIHLYAECFGSGIEGLKLREHSRLSALGSATGSKTLRGHGRAGERGFGLREASCGDSQGSTFSLL